MEHFVPLTFLGNHDVTRVASQISDPRHWSHAVALLGFLPGVPCVYYGDEFGLEAVKENRPSGDDAVRPEMPKDRWLFTHSHPEVEQVYRRMIGLRRRNSWLVDAVIETQQVENASLIIRARARHGEQSLALALNLTGEPFALADSVEVLEAEPAVADGAVAPHGWAVISGLRPARVRRSNDQRPLRRLMGGAVTRRQVRPTTTAGCAARTGRPLRSGGIGTSWSWSPRRSSRAAPAGAGRRWRGRRRPRA